MFILGDSDELVRFSLFKNMFDSCPADRKKLQLEENSKHACPRSEKCVRNAFEFLGQVPDSVEQVTLDSVWEKTFNVGNNTRELLMDLTGFDFLGSDRIFPANLETVDDSRIFDDPKRFKKKSSPVRANLLDLKIERHMIPRSKNLPKSSNSTPN